MTPVLYVRRAGGQQHNNSQFASLLYAMRDVLPFVSTERNVKTMRKAKETLCKFNRQCVPDHTNSQIIAYILRSILHGHTCIPLRARTLARCASWHVCLLLIMFCVNIVSMSNDCIHHAQMAWRVWMLPQSWYVRTDICCLLYTSPSPRD